MKNNEKSDDINNQNYINKNIMSDNDINNY